MIPWWNAQDGSLYGAIGGSALGVFAGTLGAFAGYLAPRGKAKRLVYSLFLLIIAAGIGALGVGVFALATGQPGYVWYPLLLAGGIAVLVMAPVLPAVRARYLQAELRRLDAEALRRG